MFSYCLAGDGGQRISLTRSKPIVAFFVCLAMLCFSQTYVLAQSNMVLYNMQYVPQSHQLNPGQMPYMKWHLGLPALSSIRLGIGSTGFDYERINAQIEADQATYSTLISPTAPEFNRGVFDFELQLLNFGFQLNKGKSYLSFDVADAFYASGNYTRDFARMFDQIERNVIQDTGVMTFDQSRQNFNLSYYRSYGVGFTQQVNKKLSVGIRARYLQGILSLQSENQDFRFRYPGEGINFDVQGQLNVMTAGRTLVEDVDGVSSFFPAGNGGFAFDIGGLYRLNHQWEFSFAIQQLGQINWNQDVNYTVIDNQFNFSAVDIDDHMDTWSAVADSLLDGQGLNTRESFTTSLPQRYFIGVNYFFAPNSSVGVLLSPIHYYKATDLNLALSLQTRLAKILGISTVFGHTRYADFTFGAGLSLELGPFQVYASTEALFSTPNWRSAQMGQAQLGINLNFGRYKRSDIVVEEERVDLMDVALVKPDSTRKKRKRLKEDKPSREKPERMAPTKEKPAKAAPEPKVSNPSEPESPVLEYVAPGYYLFSASIADLQTGLRVDRAKYEVYTMGGDGQKELTLIGSAMDGKLSVQLAINQVYILKLIAQGYQEQEVPLRKVGVEKSQKETRSGIKLVPKDTTASTSELTPEEDNAVTTPQPQPIPPQQTSPPVEEVAPTVPTTPEADIPDAVPTTTTPEPVQFTVSQNTSLRKAATHTSGVILRLRTTDQVELLEKTSTNWWKIKFKDQVGFAKSALLEEL